MKIVSVVRNMAESKVVTPSQVALAWLLHKGNDIVPIPGTKRRIFLEENIGTADLVLTSSDIKELDYAIPEGSTAGSRYSEKRMAFIDR